MPNTVRLHRVLATKPERVYRAFLEADATAKWLPPNGFACTVHQKNPTVGGSFRMSFRNFTSGMRHAFGGKFLQLVAGELVSYVEKFEDSAMPGEMRVTVKLKAVPVGTEVEIVQEGIPEVIAVSGCYLGWQESLRNLARLGDRLAAARTDARLNLSRVPVALGSLMPPRASTPDGIC